MKPMMAGGAANFKSKGLLEISPRTIKHLEEEEEEEEDFSRTTGQLHGTSSHLRHFSAKINPIRLASISSRLDGRFCY